jgi:hypothetical protein
MSLHFMTASSLGFDQAKSKKPADTASGLAHPTAARRRLIGAVTPICSASVREVEFRRSAAEEKRAPARLPLHFHAVSR